LQPDSISQKTARRMALHAQLLDGRTPLLRGRDGAAQVVEHLGYVQIDTISVIERAHHHTLWTRVPGYTTKLLHEIQAIDRRVFEYWGHAASYLPMNDYRFYIPTMHSFHNPTNAWYRGWIEKYGQHLGPVLDSIRAEGPKAARDFENPSKRAYGPWWDWRPAKAALELLFWRGELMISERRGFERIYDLTERVLPGGTDLRVPASEELGRFIVQRALKALGVAGEKDIREYIRIGNKDLVAAALEQMLDCADIVRLTVEGHEGVFYAQQKALDKVNRFRARPPQVKLLSPFDNLIISRSRLKQRFDFDYALECYVPQDKRLHGYFVLPVLFGERIVGRLDPKAERRSKTLIVRRLSFEPGFRDLDGLLPELGRALCELARFNGCNTVRLENVQPKKIIAPLKRILNSVPGG
jgi:uncharacterized protein YcaQ